jgi:hypothetical protein
MRSNITAIRMRRFWSWVADRIEYAAMSVRLAILDKVCGPEPSTHADRQRDAEHERLQRAFPYSKQIVRDRSPERLAVPDHRILGPIGFP